MKRLIRKLKFRIKSFKNRTKVKKNADKSFKDIDDHLSIDNSYFTKVKTVFNPLRDEMEAVQSMDTLYKEIKEVEAKKDMLIKTYKENSNESIAITALVSLVVITVMGFCIGYSRHYSSLGDVLTYLVSFVLSSILLWVGLKIADNIYLSRKSSVSTLFGSYNFSVYKDRKKIKKMIGELKAEHKNMLMYAEHISESFITGVCDKYKVKIGSNSASNLSETQLVKLSDIVKSKTWN